MKNIIDQKSDVSPKISNKNSSQKNKNSSSDSKNYIKEKFKTNNILIAIRVRPLNSSEKEDSDYKTIKIITENKLIISIPTEYSFEKKSQINHIQVIKEKQSIYEYDFILDEDSSQSKVYQYTSYELLYQIIEGYNATIFAYGATGTGKTYTMVGEGANVGIMILSLRDLFIFVNNSLTKDKKFTIKISYIEIYNEIIKDLLSSNDSIVELRSDPKKGLILKNANIKKVSNEIEAFNLIIKGNKNRTEKNTDYNNNSSRSHAILNIYIEIEDKEINQKQKKSFGKFMLLDLAGCEKTSFSNSPKNKELGSINKSLLALNKCINLLVSKNRGFIPWRDSNLTRLLQESLSGNGKIVMIATISMSLTSFDETMFTLQFASKARNIKSNMKKNIEIKNKGINKYDEFIKDIKEEIHEVKNDIIKQDKLIENKNKNLDVNNLEKKNEDKDDKNGKEINEDKKQSINENENENKELKEENKYEKIYKDMVEHFQLEIKLKKKIIEKENNIEELKNDMAEKEYEILHTKDVNLPSLQKQLKEKQEEITDKNNKILKGYIKQNELMKKRKEFQKVISFLSNNTPNTPEYYKIYHNYKYNINLLDKMAIEHKRNMYNQELKRKDRKIEGLMEQILLRDKFIWEACEKFEKKKIDFNYQNHDFIKSKDLEKFSFYPKTLKVSSMKELFKNYYIKKESISKNDNKINNGEIKKNNKEVNSEKKLTLKRINFKNNRNYKLNNIFSEAGNHSLLISKRIKNDLFSDSIKNGKELDFNSMINDLKNKSKIIKVKRPLKGLNLKSKSFGKINKVLMNEGYKSEKIIDNKKIKYDKEEMNDLNSNNKKSLFENLETEIQKKIKTIIRKNYIVRYKKSPYLKFLEE